MELFYRKILGLVLDTVYNLGIVLLVIATGN